MDDCVGDLCLDLLAHGGLLVRAAAGGHAGSPSAFHPAIHHHGPGLPVKIVLAVVLVLLGGVFAGLTIALMGQDVTHLEVIAKSGESVYERRNAARVLDLLRMGKHWVLVSLLLSNVITNETLPIVLDSSVGNGWVAILSSTLAIGELKFRYIIHRCPKAIVLK